MGHKKFFLSIVFLVAGIFSVAARVDAADKSLSQHVDAEAIAEESELAETAVEEFFAEEGREKKGDCGAGCYNCDPKDGTKCLSCIDGMKPAPPKGQCVPCPRNCLNCAVDANGTPTSCDWCASGKWGSMCDKSCSTDCNTCTRDTGVCTDCRQGNFPKRYPIPGSGECSDKPCLPNCAKCDSLGGQTTCRECEGGYSKLTPNGQCEACPGTIGPDNTSCSSCKKVNGSVDCTLCRYDGPNSNRPIPPECQKDRPSGCLEWEPGSWGPTGPIPPICKTCVSPTQVPSSAGCNDGTVQDCAKYKPNGSCAECAKGVPNSDGTKCIVDDKACPKGDCVYCDDRGLPGGLPGNVFCSQCGLGCQRTPLGFCDCPHIFGTNVPCNSQDGKALLGTGVKCDTVE